MKERSILFSGPMVRAILEGRKTVTRRVVKHPGDYTPSPRECSFCCPYGQPGDRLWVRETWRVGAWGDDDIAVDYRDGGLGKFTPVENEDLWERLVNDSIKDAYKARIKADDYGFYKWDRGEGPCRWRPSIHMPRWASRITLEVTGVRMERLQDITEEDAIREGMEIFQRGTTRYESENRDLFKKLWDELNGSKPDYAWCANPWVWVVSFKKLEVKL